MTARRRLDSWMIVFLVFVSTFQLTQLTIGAMEDSHDPVEFHSAEFVETLARPGQIVRLRVDRTRFRVCPGLAYEAWEPPPISAALRDTRTVQGSVMVAGASMDIGRGVTEFAKQIPHRITEPGKWCYNPLLVYECPDGMHIMRQPLACVEVLIGAIR